ncbi:MAG: hypothetical protein AMXMBFR64_61110 [Myxococcales bacterium]
MTIPDLPPTLGELELAVLDVLWQRGESDVKDVHDLLGRPRGITLNTVQSTLKRLHEKGMLRRQKVSHAYLYAPAMTREDLHRLALRQVVERLMDGEPGAMVSAFVDLTERAGAEHLERLEELVEARLRARAEHEG